MLKAHHQPSTSEHRGESFALKEHWYEVKTPPQRDDTPIEPAAKHKELVDTKRQPLRAPRGRNTSGNHTMIQYQSRLPSASAKRFTSAPYSLWGGRWSPYRWASSWSRGGGSHGGRDAAPPASPASPAAAASFYPAPHALCVPARWSLSLRVTLSWVSYVDFGTISLSASPWGTTHARSLSCVDGSGSGWNGIPFLVLMSGTSCKFVGLVVEGSHSDLKAKINLVK